MTSDAQVVIGLDVGTSAVKAVAVDQIGTTVATAESAQIATSVDPPGASEQQTEEIWDEVVAAVRALCDELGGDERVVALSMAAQSGSVVPLDASGAPASRAFTWMDTRSRPVVASWSDATHDQIREVTGWQSSAGLGLATIAWLRTRRPFPESPGFTSVDDYLIGRLTGSPLTNPSNAAGMQLMDVAKLQWSEPLCALAGIDPSALSPIRLSGSTAGGLQQSAATALGLKPDTQVIVGGHDQACATLGLGATEPGSIALSAGTAWVMTAITDRPSVEDLPPSLNLSPHLANGSWSVSENLGPLGAALAWILEASPTGSDEAHHSDRAPYFLPHLHDENRTSWGTFVSAEDSSETARLHAVFEACAFEFKLAIEQAGAFTDPGAAVTVVGGGTRSPILMQMIADAVGRPLIIKPDASWPALGAAKLAATACGWATGGPDEMGGVQVEPDLGMLSRTEQRYQHYLNLRGEASP